MVGAKRLPRGLGENGFPPGGRYLYGLKTPDGGVMWGRFIYREIDEPSRIVTINSFSDENGGVSQPPDERGMAGRMALDFLS